MRIKKIAEMVKGANTLLDIGTDHGKVIIEALIKGYINNAIAADINDGPLKRAYKNIKKQKLLTKVKFIKTDGFKNINLNYDVVSITGLGFQTIKKILEVEHKHPKFYIFGVQSEIENFRKYLSNNGYKIINEEIIFDKKFYIFIKAIFENETLSFEDIILGPFIKKRKEAIPYYKQKISKLEEKMPHLKDEELTKRKEELDLYFKAINKSL